jgi:hypothetical protein
MKCRVKGPEPTVSLYRPEISVQGSVRPRTDIRALVESMHTTTITHARTCTAPRQCSSTRVVA